VPTVPTVPLRVTEGAAICTCTATAVTTVGETGVICKI
jgi:hypothetical protein